MVIGEKCGSKERSKEVETKARAKFEKRKADSSLRLE
jgi:hypothetical protein